MAWLHSTPKNPAKTAKVSSKVDLEREPTRGEKIEKNGGAPIFPDVGDAAYLVYYWQSAGMFGVGAMGPVTLTSSELMAWQTGNSIDLNPWEFRTVREMSRAYVAQLSDSESPACPPPYGEQAAEFDRSIVSKKVSSAFKSFLSSRK